MSFVNAMEKLATLPYRGFALEGGGVAGIGHVGNIKYLDSIGLYSKLTHFDGSSAGAMIAGLAACRVSPAKMQEIMLKMDFHKFEDSSWFVFRDIYCLCKQFGWNQGLAIGQIYSEVLQDCIGDANITFSQVKKRFGSTLITTVTEMKSGSTIYCTPETTPDMPIAEAVRRSGLIPLFFGAAQENGKIYVDGGTLNNYPIRKLYEYLPKEQVIGSKLLTTAEINREPAEINNLIDYCKVLVGMLHDQNLKVHVEDEDWDRTIKIDIGSVKATDFGLTEAQRLTLIASGEAAAKKFFTS